MTVLGADELPPPCQGGSPLSDSARAHVPTGEGERARTTASYFTPARPRRAPAGASLACGFTSQLAAAPLPSRGVGAPGANRFLVRAESPPSHHFCSAGADLRRNIKKKKKDWQLIFLTRIPTTVSLSGVTFAKRLPPCALATNGSGSRLK